MNKFEISNLDLFYGQMQALKNVELKIPERQITAFIGPSGCGKSTLLRTLNRMNDLVEGCRITGNVLLDGQDSSGHGNPRISRGSGRGRRRRSRPGSPRRAHGPG